MEIVRNIYSIQVFMVVFDAGNVTRAARLLNISQSSVSYHIKKLEEDLSVALFRRTASGLQPTEQGTQLAQHVERGLGAIRTGLDRIAHAPASVRIALLPMFASRWLSSRLGHLLEANPDMNLSIQNHNNSYVRMNNPERFADLGIQWGRGNWDSFHVTRLWKEKLVVLCSPTYLKSHPIRQPSDILGCTLLHVDDTRMWEEWLSGNHLALETKQSQMILEDRHFQLSSTINGIGVSLFASWLVRDELEKGILINPFEQAFDTSFAYHVVVPKMVEPTITAQRFHAWICNQSDMPGAKAGKPVEP
ncbi:transcriptional regulator [Zhengella mangrovi]|uniref:Transcriptional regulator n=1 Tax=Zhengella mangrovi TaxID=1982044 RepID=A0A2G1QIE1_9HYPH|nr:LysR substrate-binding domain-containing protein [Zhengella mangrovi]PHP64978.1 transcriptional regulator [Zhengella mangrovi]